MPMLMRSVLIALALGALLAVIAGCASNAGPAFSEHGGPSADTGPVSESTTGGDAAGTFNLKREAKPHGEAAGH